MRSIMTSAALFAAAILTATAASATPGLVSGAMAPQAADSTLIQVHGVHRACERGPAGWHRSLPNGNRVTCRAARPSGVHWSWRKNGPDFGWYHTRDRRWH